MWPGLASRLRDWWSGFRMPVLANDFSCYQNFQTRYETHLDSYSVATGVLFPRKSGLGVNETTHLHVGPRLSMSGAVRLLPPICLQAWTGKTLPFYLFCWLLLSVPQTCDQRWTYAACEIRGPHSVLRKSCTSIWKPTRSSTCGCKRFLYPSKHRDRLRDPLSHLFRGCREFLPCG